MLMAVMVASMVVAVGAALLAWTLFREDRERSVARVAALAAEIEGSEARAFRTEHGDTAVEAGGGALFGPPTTESSVRRLAPALIAAGVLAVGAIAVIMALGGDAGTAAAEPPPDQGPPLELLALRHETTSGQVRLTGLLRNPIGNVTLTRITAVVFLFDEAGGFLASGRAPLDFGVLVAGEESPFVVTIDAPPGVARYRVSFRKDEGGMMAHVDRRGRTP